MIGSTLVLEPKEARQEHLMRFGAVCHVLSRKPTHHSCEASWMQSWLEVASELSLLQVFYRTNGKPFGYLAWAFLAEDVQERLRCFPHATLHLSEWTEGKEPWLIDLVTCSGSARQILRHAAKHLFSEYSKIGVVRRGADGGVCKLRQLSNPFYERTSVVSLSS